MSFDDFDSNLNSDSHRHLVFHLLIPDKKVGTLMRTSQREGDP